MAVIYHIHVPLVTGTDSQGTPLASVSAEVHVHASGKNGHRRAKHCSVVSLFMSYLFNLFGASVTAD